MAEKTYDILIKDLIGERTYKLVNVSHGYIDRLTLNISHDKIGICAITEHKKDGRDSIECKL